MIRRGSLVELDGSQIAERMPHLVKLVGRQWKVDGVSGTKGNYRVLIDGTSLPLDVCKPIPQKKGKQKAA